MEGLFEEKKQVHFTSNGHYYICVGTKSVPLKRLWEKVAASQKKPEAGRSRFMERMTTMVFLCGPANFLYMLQVAQITCRFTSFFAQNTFGVILLALNMAVSHNLPVPRGLAMWQPKPDKRPAQQTDSPWS